MGETIFRQFPPFSLIARCGKKIQTDIVEGLMIVPMRLTQPWYSQLLHLLVDVPGVLPRQETSLMDGLHNYCHKRQFDPVCATVSQVLDFLVEIFESGIGFSVIKKTLHDQLHPVS